MFKKKSFFLKNGYLIIKSYYPKIFIKKIFNELVNNYKLINKIRSKEDLMVSFNNPNDENLISNFYNLVKKNIKILDILSFKQNNKIVKDLLGHNNYGFLNRGFGFRLDYPFRDKFLTQLHQDYHAQLGSPNGLVFYTPLTSIKKKEDGPVVVYEGSHKKGIRKISIKKSYDKSTSYILELKKNELSNYKKIYLYLDEGDLAVFHFSLLHESSLNNSSKVRVSFIHRYFDFNHPISKANKFVGGIHEGNFFEDYHPNLIV